MFKEAYQKPHFKTEKNKWPAHFLGDCGSCSGFSILVLIKFRARTEITKCMGEVSAWWHGQVETARAVLYTDAE